MSFKRDKALHRQVAEKLRGGLVKETAAGSCLPPESELARRWGVSTRTVREALLVLEAEGRVERQQGRGTVVRRPDLPVALFSELNILHPQAPRFYGIVLDLIRQRLVAEGYASRLYTGKSCPGDTSGPFTCLELVADAQAGKLAGIMALASRLDTPALRKLQQEGLPVVSSELEAPVLPNGGPLGLMRIGVDYLASVGRRRIGLIAWDEPPLSGKMQWVSVFREILAEHGLPFSPNWCRSDLSFAWGGAGWEEFREIWFGGVEKPDALLVADENYLPEVTMAVIQLGIRVPQELLIVSHRTRHVQWAAPLPVAYIEENVDAFAHALVDRLLARVENRPEPEIPAASVYQLFPVHDLEEPATAPKPKLTGVVL